MIANRNRCRWARRILPALAAAIVLAAMLWGQQPAGPKPAGRASGSGATTSVDRSAVTPSAEPTFAVVRGDVVKKLVISGELTAARSIEISVPMIRSAFSTMVTYLAPEGALIRQGERVVEFDSSSLVSQKTEAERRLAEAKLKIDKQKADLEAQRCDLLNSAAQAESSLKVSDLYGKISKDLLPGNTYQQYQVNLDKAKLSLQKAKEQLANFETTYASQMALVEISRDQAEVDLKKIDNDLARLSVNAPQDGIVIYGDNWASNRKIQVGDNLFPRMPVVTIPDLTSMQVVGFVYDTELSSLAVGMRCEFGLDALPGNHRQGVIASITSVASRKGFATQQKVFRAVIQPDKVDLTVMKPGMTAHVEIAIKLAADTMTAPREYFGLDEGRRYYVMARKDPRKVEKKYVELGLFGDRMVQILSGVDIGDELVAVQTESEVGR
jgi:HlyD family secretion protein